jgi:translocation and assembly module TamB
MSGDASLRGDGAGAALEARLTVNEADLRIPDSTSVSIPTLDVVTREEADEIAPEAGPQAYPVRLDVGIDAPAKLFVRGRGLQSEWGGELKVTGDASEPKIIGVLNIRRGFIDLVEKRFVVREGVVRFAGANPPIPILNLVAAATAEDVEAIVRLTGPATDPKLELSSEPNLPADEILARVLFGRSLNRISPVQGLRLAAAANQLRGGGGLTSVIDSMRRSIGLDSIDVRGGATAAESSAAVGKYLSDKVYLELQEGLQAGSGKARVEVELTPNLSVGTAVTDQSQTGVNLQWRYDY